MNITITSSMFDLLFFLVIFLFGLDFTLSGVLGLKNFEKELRIPIPFSLWIIKRVVSINPFKRENNFISWLYSIKTLIFLFLLGGILIVFASSIMIVDILLNKTLFSIN